MARQQRTINRLRKRRASLRAESKADRNPVRAETKRKAANKLGSTIGKVQKARRTSIKEGIQSIRDQKLSKDERIAARQKLFAQFGKKNVENQRSKMPLPEKASDIAKARAKGLQGAKKRAKKSDGKAATRRAAVEKERVRLTSKSVQGSSKKGATVGKKRK